MPRWGDKRPCSSEDIHEGAKELHLDEGQEKNKNEDTHAGGAQQNTVASGGHAASPVASSPQTGRLVGSGDAWFPVMTPGELATIAVPSSAPREEVQRVLEEQGVCLITGVLSAQECQDMERLWHTDLLSLLDRQVDAWLPEETAMAEGLQLHGPSAWPRAWSSCLGKKGCASQRGIPHGSFAWAARMHPKVRQAFADVFNTAPTDLAVGLDVTFFSAADSPGVESNNEWLHCDQNHQTGLTWRCMQGVLYIWPSEGDCASTTVVWPGSHTSAYQELMLDESARKGGGQSVRLSSLKDQARRQKLTAEAVAGARRIPCPAGSLLLWDSRTIHQGWGGGPRLAQPVCWEPKARREKDRHALARKVFMCASGVPSSHSAAEGRVHGMATRVTPTPAWGGALRAQLRPWGVEEGKEQEWAQLQHWLWAGTGDPRRNAGQVAGASLASLLKKEVLDVL